MAKMTREKCVATLESMYCANLVKIDSIRDGIKKAKRRKAPFNRIHSEYLAATLPVRLETVAALGYAIDALRKEGQS